jgi:tetratricopeptide (TPR) repeat protein
MSKRKKSLNKSASRGRPWISSQTALTVGAAAGFGLIAVVVLVAYFPSISGGFIWDDYLLLVDNPLIKASNGLHQIWCTAQAIDYWPATNTSFWIEWRLWGMNSPGYHVTNLVLHVLESLLIWIILRKLSVPGAFLAALLFAVHPVNVESVAWIAQRKNTMAMLFFLLSILWYIKAALPTASAYMASVSSRGGPWERENSPSSLASSPWPLAPSPWYWLSLAAFVLAMLGKGSTAMLPVLLLGIVWRQRPLTKWDLVRIAPFFFVAAILAAVNMEFQTHAVDKVIRAIGFVDRLLGAGGVVWFYLYKAIFPIDLAFVYLQWHIEVGNLLWWLPLISALALTAALWLYRKSWSRELLFAWGFFCVALVPVMGFTDVAFMQYSLVADRYQHIAIIGVVALASALWSPWFWRVRGGMRSAAIAVAVAGVCALMFLTLRQSALYRDAMTLYQATLEKNPDCDMAQYNYANALSKTNRLEEALDHYKQALKLKPDFIMVYYNLGNTLLQMGRPQEAVEHFQEFLRRKPRQAEVHGGLGSALARLGRTKEAMEEYEEALRLKPDLLQAHLNLGNMLVQEMRPQEAIEHFQQALRLQPDCLEACANLGIALALTGRVPEAIDFFRRCLLVKPNDAETHKNLGNALMQTGRPHEAIEHFKQAVRIKPDYIGAYNSLALAYASVNQSSQAVATAKKALDLARSQGQTALTRQIEDWLNSYQGHGTSGEVQKKD